MSEIFSPTITVQLSFLQQVKKLILNDSHLRDYLLFIGESEHDKCARIINDPSYHNTRTNDTYWEEILPSWDPFDPTQVLHVIWQCLVCMIILFYYIEMGCVLAFGELVWQEQLNSPVYYLNYFNTAILIIECWYCANRGYFTSGILVNDRRRILARYVKRYLVIDSLMILSILLCMLSRSLALNYLKIVMVFQLTRLDEVDRIIQRNLQTHRLSKALYVIFRLLLIVLLMCHVIGLIFYAIDYYLLVNGIFPPQDCWLYTSTAYNNIIGMAWSIQYLYALYWGVNTLTTISYGDIAAGNPVQVVYAIFCFILAFVIYGYVINNIVQIIIWAKKIQDDFSNELIVIDTFMKRKMVIESLQIKIREYLEFVYHEESLRDKQLQNIMLRRLPEQLREAVMKDAFKNFYLRMSGTFAHFPPQFMDMLVFSIQQRNYANNEVIFGQKDSPDQHSIYMLQKGMVELSLEFGERNSKILSTFSLSNKMFGQYEFYTDVNRRYSAVCRKSSTVYLLTKLSLLQLFTKFPVHNQFYRELLDSVIFKGMLNNIGYECTLCGKNHLFENCPDYFPVFDIDFISHETRSGRDPASLISSRSLIRKMTKAKVFGYRKRTQKKDEDHYVRYLPKIENQHSLRQMLEQRLAILHEQIVLLKEKFEVDLYYDWQKYEPDWNYSRVQEKFNAGQKDSNFGSDN